MLRTLFFPRNDNVQWLRGVVDELDPINSDGSPKWINNATGTWQIRTHEHPEGGVSVASGSITAVGAGGAYYIAMPNSIAIDVDDPTDDDETNFHLHIYLAAGAYIAQLSRSLRPVLRTGATPVT